MTNHETTRNAPAPGTGGQHLAACEYCDAVYQRTGLADGERAQCRRCGGTLYRESARAYRRLLPLVVTALILFLVSNIFPIVEMDLKGIRMQTTLWGAVQALYAERDMALVALLVLATTILLPLAEMLMMLHLLAPMARRRLPAGFEYVVRYIRRTRPWGMIEVYLLGVVVTLVKLSSVADILPGPALWSFSALVVVLAVMLSFDPRDLWQYREPPR